MTKNLLYYGDNLQILRDYIKDETIDLVYLDPPFKSNQDYNVLFAEQNGSRSAAQIKAFEDTWEWNTIAAAAYQEIVESGYHRVSQAMQAFRTFLGESDMMAYLAMMAPRLVELRRVLKPTGSIYLHCDPAASHYLKMLMDAVFGNENFVSEILWKKIRSPKGQTIGFGNVHDTILLFSKATGFCFHRQYVSLSEKRLKQHYSGVDEGTGRRYMLDNFTQAGTGPARKFGNKVIPPPSGKHWIWGQDRIDKGLAEGRLVFTSANMVRVKRYLDESSGKPVDDIWADIAPLNSQAAERLGYPTQKPESLLERIMRASSNEGDTILDPFCGCGTTIAVAEKLHRRWIGIDITHLAVALMKHRLEDMFGEKIRKTYEVLGEPTDLSGAKQLAQDDPYQFQWWALGLVGARPVEQKKGADKGIDGRLYFHDEPDSSKAKTKQILLSVKAGHTGRAHVGELRGVIEREHAEIGVFICMQKATKPMRTETASAGFYKSPWQKKPYPRLQILTIEELLNGKRIDCPPLGQVNVTFKKAPKAKGMATEQPELEYPQK